MAKRTVFNLSAEGEDWVLREKGAARATRRFDTKGAAVSASPAIVRKKAPSRLVIKKANGRIQEQRNYDA